MSKDSFIAVWNKFEFDMQISCMNVIVIPYIKHRNWRINKPPVVVGHLLYSCRSKKPLLTGFLWIVLDMNSKVPGYTYTFNYNSVKLLKLERSCNNRVNVRWRYVNCFLRYNRSLFYKNIKRYSKTRYGLPGISGVPICVAIRAGARLRGPDVPDRVAGSRQQLGLARHQHVQRERPQARPQLRGRQPKHHDGKHHTVSILTCTSLSAVLKQYVDRCLFTIN